MGSASLSTAFAAIQTSAETSILSSKCAAAVMTTTPHSVSQERPRVPRRLSATRLHRPGAHPGQRNQCNKKVSSPPGKIPAIRRLARTDEHAAGVLDDSCFVRGATVGYDASAHAQALQAVKAFLHSALKLVK